MSPLRLAAILLLTTAGSAFGQGAAPDVPGPLFGGTPPPDLLQLERVLAPSAQPGPQAAEPAARPPADAIAAGEAGPRRKPEADAAPAAGGATQGSAPGGGGLSLSPSSGDQGPLKSDGPLIVPPTVGSWQFVPELNSARMAASGWSLLAMSGLSWPDGRQGILTFWNDSADRRSGFYVRCLAYFDLNMGARGEKCEGAIAGDPGQGPIGQP